MTPSRFNSLVNGLPRMNQLDKAFKSHVGGGVYVTISEGYKCVNIRQYFLPAGCVDEKPTKKGIALSFMEFKAFIDCIDAISDVSLEIKNAIPCNFDFNHNDPLMFLACKECNPFHTYC